MAEDTKYVPVPLLYRSKGLVAREVTDRAPENTYLLMTNCQEREEEAMSSRYGTVIVNRDPVGTGTNNYPFPTTITSLSRLTYLGSSWRYAGTSDGQLWRRSGNTQGAYTSIYSGLSGEPFDSLVTNPFLTSQPYLFVYDDAASIKDDGTGTPTLTGIDPPDVTAAAQPYSPLLTLIDNFNSSNTYTTSGFSTPWGSSPVTNIAATSGSTVTDFPYFLNSGGSAGTFGPICDGMLSVLNANGTVNILISSIVSSGLVSGVYTTLTVTTVPAHGLSTGFSVSIYGSSNSLLDGYYSIIVTGPNTFTVPFFWPSFLNATGGFVNGGASAPSTCVLTDEYSEPYPTQFSAWGFYQSVSTGTTSFPVVSWSGTVAANSTATVGKNIGLDLSINNQVKDDDLIVLTLAVGTPANVTNIRLQFDVNNSGYTSSYYYKDITPAYYQGNISNTVGAYNATQNQILGDTLGLFTGATPNSTTAQLQPGNFSTGGGAWVAVDMRRGDFLPVGNAGQSGLDWVNVTGWQIVITTSATGGSTVSANGLYLQWGYGPSSIGGVGYDYRYTFYNANTGTESNPSPMQNFSEQYGILSTLKAPFFFRQAVSVNGNFSLDPQVTHVRIYRRGGLYPTNWFLVDQIVNNPVHVAVFTYKDTIADAVLAQALILSLDNDAPVSSSLQVPISTTLSAAIPNLFQFQQSSYQPANPATAVQTVTVVGSEVFVPNQVVNVGNADNLEQVLVVTGGTGQFSAVFCLDHNAGENVLAYSVPRQPCNLCALAYGQTWLAGDDNNPGYLYFSKKEYPENFPPQNYINVSTPSDPINAVINWRGTLYVGTLTTWYIIQGGANPIAQPTGSMHGIVAQHGWIQTESSIWYLAADGLREFRGSEGTYMSLNVEWVFRDNPLTPLPLFDNTQASSAIMCYYNNQVYISYIALDSNRYRLIYDTIYRRFRNDTLPMTAMLWEQDTNTFLGAYFIPNQPGFVTTTGWVIVQDQVYSQDYDDGGWGTTSLGARVLQQNVIKLTLQTPYQDLGKPHFPKQYNVLETDVNTQSQTMNTSLLFDDGSVTLTLPSNITTARQKVEMPVNAGSGQQGYRMSLQHTMSVKVAPIFYQENIYAAELAAFRYSFDTYWILGGSNLHKLVKQCVFDYTSAVTVVFNLYADNSTTPYYTFTLPIAANRATIKVRFPALKMRQFRMIGNVSSGNSGFQNWAAPQLWWKPVLESVSYQQMDLVT